MKKIFLLVFPSVIMVLFIILAISCKKNTDRNNTVQDVTVTDKDGNVYHSVKIGTQTWTVENLKVTKLNDGTSIPNVTANTEWSILTTPGYCWYNNDVANKNLYGGLYNWYAVSTGKLCPISWHVPSDAEWTTLINFLGGETVAGGKMKEVGLSHWNDPNIGATNSSGFTGLSGGVRGNFGTFYYLGGDGYWWNSTESSISNARSIVLHFYDSNASRYSDLKWIGFSVRCIKD